MRQFENDEDLQRYVRRVHRHGMTITIWIVCVPLFSYLFGEKFEHDEAGIFLGSLFSLFFAGLYYTISKNRDDC